MSEKAGTNINKDVIYIDVDDEITTIIDKVRGSSSKIVAVVLPKRATVLQSIVNMKLLKRSSDEAKKNMVLITSEVGLMPLAGSAGVHVAKSLQSKPEIPEAAGGGAQPEDLNEDAATLEDIADEKPLDKTKPVGDLAGASDPDETINFDNDQPGYGGNPAGGKGKDKDKGKGSGKKFQIPNFSRFRLILILGVVGIAVLAIVIVLCASVLPKATISIKTDSTAITSSTVISLRTASSTQLDVKDAIVPAKSQQTQKTLTQQTDATGQQNDGEKATGTVTVKNCTDSAVTIPQGTGVVSNGNTYITKSAIVLSSGNYDSQNKCKDNGAHIGTANVVAQQAGAKYNTGSNSNYTVVSFSGLTASGTDMTGGTDKITKIVTQSDIDAATQKIAAQDTTAVKKELKTSLNNSNYMPIEATFAAATPQTKSSVNAGDKADNVTVTQTITYSMLGAKEADLKKIIDNDISSNIDTKKQNISDYGLSNAVFGLQSQPAEGADVTMQTTVVAGPDLKVEDIKKQVAGKKAGAAKELIKQNPGVTDVTVNYSPFWVSSIPKKTSKIIVTIEKPQKTIQSSSSDANVN